MNGYPRSEGIRFAEVMNDFRQEDEGAGASRQRRRDRRTALKLKLEAVRNLLPYIKLVERERLSVRFETEEEYNEFFASDEVDRLFRELIADKLAISQIMVLLREKPLSTGEISERLGSEPV